MNGINKLEEDLRIETVKTRMKEKPVGFKMKIKKQQEKKIELEKEIIVEITIKIEVLKLEILRKIIEKKSRESNTERKLKKRNEKLIIEEINQGVQ